MRGRGERYRGREGNTRQREREKDGKRERLQDREKDCKNKIERTLDPRGRPGEAQGEA